MPRHGKAVLTSLIAVLMLTMAVGAASARNYRLLNWERGFRIAWPELRIKNGVEVNQANCPVTLEGSFHSATIRKVFREEIGQITRAVAGACISGTAAPVRGGLPWPLEYESFTGTLPLITTWALRLIRASFEIRWNLLRTCTTTTSDASPLGAIATTPEERLGLHLISSVRMEERERIGLTGELGACETETPAAFFGSGTATVLGETERTRFTLI